MKGSFESPPIIIRTSRTFSLIGFVVCIAFFCLGLAPVFLGRIPFEIGDHLLSIAIGLGVLYFGWQLVSPSSLILEPEGFNLENQFQGTALVVERHK